ncbi:hypothetical protein ITP53_40385 [Nonomuraea sp. K274]|uniref:Uncharacterized protein n=1 Tax=Nonomuraea cypriaca TaxID=1187855 RepID=A0A931AFE5_9ACTN|nr:hypothetical protein [Nonomuraea cypriaca]MBF8191836.1 hypothetical protein [Nonomuraea cypriaca]
MNHIPVRIATGWLPHVVGRRAAALSRPGEIRAGVLLGPRVRLGRVGAL